MQKFLTKHYHKLNPVVHLDAQREKTMIKCDLFLCCKSTCERGKDLKGVKSRKKKLEGNRNQKGGLFCGRKGARKREIRT